MCGHFGSYRPHRRTALVGQYGIQIAALCKTRFADVGEIKEVMNDRLMTLRLPLSSNKHVKFVSVYVPSMSNPGEVKVKFYNELDDVISATPRTDKLILLGD